MTMNRRSFLDASLALAGAAALPAAGVGMTGLSVPGLAPRRDGAGSAPARDLRLLILGGTGFIGPHMVRAALDRGHSVTLFNRGRTNPGLFPEVETLIGDRDGELDALRGRQWDAAIDNSGYVPRLVRDSAELLRDSVDRYVFTSTGSVYQFDQYELPEDAGLLPIEDPESEDVNRYYGPLKVMCEQAVQEIFEDRGTVVRLHVVAGPGDPTDRFTYWPVRIDAGGEVLAPGDRDNPVQFIDARDLADFNMRLIEQATGGIFNAAGPRLAETGMEQFIYGVRAATSTEASFTWVDEAFLQEQQPPVRFPLWYSQNGSAPGLSRVRSHRGVAAGLTFRPLAVTAMDTLEWFKSQPEERRSQLQLNLERDAQVLTEWKRR